MFANSRQVFSSQTDLHEQLAILVERHRTTLFKKPVNEVNLLAYRQAIAMWDAAKRPALIIDSCCGVGISTLNLAQKFPKSFVIGIDQSADRLSRQIKWPAKRPENFFLVRADVVDFWRLLLDAGIHPSQHYLLYPNPWPKKTHVGRRWHGHAVFPTLVALGGIIECRSNWKIYIDEFAAALQQLTGKSIASEPYLIASVSTKSTALPTPITPFEEKYHTSGHALWRCRALL
jgi:tRNA (guanine-N7-)-methyltransferase